MTQSGGPLRLEWPGPWHFRCIGFRIAAVTTAVLVVLALLHHRPWVVKPAYAGQTLGVGFLPVTCHLTCPVTDFATKTTTTSTRFESQRFSDFPTVVEALKARELDATFILAPLAMVLRSQGVPVKIVYLGHRDGSTVMVAKKLLEYVLTLPPDRVSYRMLTPTKAELTTIMEYAIKAGILQKPIDIDQLFVQWLRPGGP